jgi:hypothetical protein
LIPLEPSDAGGGFYGKRVLAVFGELSNHLTKEDGFKGGASSPCLARFRRQI